MGEKLEEVKILDVSEGELESFVKLSLGDIETGLALIDTQINTYRGPLDILAIDSERCLVIIELKVRENDDMLFQVVDYYDWIQENIDSVSRMYRNIHPKVEINYKKPPRIMLIAPSFSSSLKRRTKYLDINIDLYIYRFVEIGGKQGLLFEQVKIPPQRFVPSSPKTIADLTNYPQNVEYRTLVAELDKAIRQVGSDVEPYPTTQYIGYKIKGSCIASVYPRKTASPYVGVLGDEKWESLSLESEDDIEKILDLVNKVYRLKKGMPDTNKV